jgi:uncharacterized membrane protein YphA (DoxX/SURF4 family)
MLKIVLIALIGLFFVLNGLNHLFNTMFLAEYAHRQSLAHPRTLVRLSGVFLIAGGIGFVIPATRQIAVLGLCVFLALASVFIHHFWTDRDRDARLYEILQFSKNQLIMVELMYIGFA